MLSGTIGNAQLTSQMELEKQPHAPRGSALRPPTLFGLCSWEGWLLRVTQKGAPLPSQNTERGRGTWECVCVCAHMYMCACVCV